MAGRRRRRKKRIVGLPFYIAAGVIGVLALTLLINGLLLQRNGDRKTEPASFGTLPVVGGLDFVTSSPEPSGTGQPELTSKQPETSGTRPIGTEPPDTVPPEMAPAESTPTESEPPETLPSETTPEETQPAETTPEASDPVPTQPPETTAQVTRPPETTVRPTTPEATAPRETTSEKTTPAATTPEATTPAETTPEETTLEETTPAETTEEVPAVLPALLLQQLAAAGMDPSELVGSQLLVVHALDTPNCEIFGYQKNGAVWTLLDNLIAVPGVLGRNGTAPIAYEGDQTTPLGYYALGPAYGRAAREDTGLEYHQIEKEDYFVDDPDSKYYNRLYKTEYHDKDWKTAEGMYELLNYYYYCIYVQYNTDPIIPGYGSVIFIHVRDGDPDTSGCVGLEEEIMIALFRWMRKEELPHVLIY